MTAIRTMIEPLYWLVFLENVLKTGLEIPQGGGVQHVRWRRQ